MANPDLPPDDLPVLGLDADDTLWENEAWFHEVEGRFRDLMSPWADSATIDAALLATERANIAHHGYGVKGFVLSMIVTAVELSDGRVEGRWIGDIVSWGHELLDHPVQLLDGVTDALDRLGTTHRLLVITKGDLNDQMGKVSRSGLADRFWRVEVVAEKDEASYAAVLDRHGVEPSAFVMVGNSIRSDVLPVLGIGGRAIHVPHTTTWALEEPDPMAAAAAEFPVVDRLADVADLLAAWPANTRGWTST